MRITWFFTLFCTIQIALCGFGWSLLNPFFKNSDTVIKEAKLEIEKVRGSALRLPKFKALYDKIIKKCKKTENSEKAEQKGGVCCGFDLTKWSNVFDVYIKVKSKDPNFDCDPEARPYFDCSWQYDVRHNKSIHMNKLLEGMCTFFDNHKNKRFIGVEQRFVQITQQYDKLNLPIRDMDDSVRTALVRMDAQSDYYEDNEMSEDDNTKMAIYWKSALRREIPDIIKSISFYTRTNILFDDINTMSEQQLAEHIEIRLGRAERYKNGGIDESIDLDPDVFKYLNKPQHEESNMKVLVECLKSMKDAVAKREAEGAMGRNRRA